MTNCKICTSKYLKDIDEMISNKANEKYIQLWCKDRGFKVHLKDIREHIKETEFVPEKVEFKFNRIYLTINELKQELDIEDNIIQTYKSNTDKKINKFDLIELMQFILHQLRANINQLQNELNNILTYSSLDKLAELKNNKLIEQVRYQNAISELKQIQLLQLENKLIEKEKQNEKWSYAFVGFKAKLESIPSKVALQLSSISDKSEIKNILDNLILEAVEELNNGC